MSFTSVGASSYGSKLRPDNAFSRVKNLGSQTIQGVKARFQMAAAAFRLRMATESQIHESSRERKRVPKVLTMMELSGFLVSKTGGEFWPLYAGQNYFEEKSSGEGLASVPQASFPEVENYVNLRVEGDQVVLERAESSDSQKSYFSNDRVELGDQSFLLKMIPKEFRPQRELYLHKSGEKHV